MIAAMPSPAARRRADRLRPLRARLRNADFDALLIVNPVDTRYLTGFVGADSWTLIAARGGKPVILSDARFEEQIAGQAPDATAVMRKKTLTEALETLVTRRGWKRVAVQAAYLTVAQYARIGKAVGRRKAVAWDDGLLTQRAVKDPAEVRDIVRAAGLQQAAFRELCDELRPGMTEAEAAAFLEYRMRTLGADGRSFPTIVAAEANAALPHAIPGRKKIEHGAAVLIDWGAKFNGYCSDMTRVVFVGRRPRGAAAAKRRRTTEAIYDVVLDAQRAGIAACRPGARMVDVDAAARDVIEAAGYGDRFGHGLGHGIGLDIHEAPRLSHQADPEDRLEPGMVVTVEPGIYLPGVGGVRIEDDVLITPRGHRVLTGTDAEAGPMGGKGAGGLPKDRGSATI